MLIPLTRAWRVDRDRRRRAAGYLIALRREPESADVRWLTDAAADGDADHAQWELRYARLALGVLTAQRDALDDQTGSDVVAALDGSWNEDARIAEGMHALVASQFNDRLGAYREALAARGGAVGASERLGRVLLAFASDGARSAGAPLPRAIALLSQYLGDASEALRANYGAAKLPEHLPPSEMAAKA